MARIFPPPAGPSRAKICLAGGAWQAQEETVIRSSSGLAWAPCGSPVALDVVAAPGSDVSLSGTSLTLKSGLAVQAVPHLATVQWRIAMTSLSGWAFTTGRVSRLIVTVDTLPASTINSNVGAVFTAPSGAWDSTAETILGISLGYGNASLPVAKTAQATGNWTTLSASASVTQAMAVVPHGSAKTDCFALSASAEVASTHATTLATQPTHLYVTGFVTTAGLLADATYANPAIYLYYGGP